MVGIKFRGKHSYDDFSLTLNYFKDHGANQKVIRDEVPYMHGSYDFSTVGSLGENVYTDRQLEAKFIIIGASKEQLRSKYDGIISWLMEGPKAELIDDRQPDLVYMAKVENYPKKEEFVIAGEFVVSFIADCFKKGISLEGTENILWDTFNFDNDFLAPTQFEVYGTKTVSLYNLGRIVTPEVIVSSDMFCTLYGYTTAFTTSKKKDWYFRLQPGENKVTIVGNGTIQFNWRKELL